MTLARLGPASAISRKKTTSPSAVHTTPRTTIEATAANDGTRAGGAAIAAGASATAARPRLAATGPDASRAAPRRERQEQQRRQGHARPGDEGRRHVGVDSHLDEEVGHAPDHRAGGEREPRAGAHRCKRNQIVSRGGSAGSAREWPQRSRR